MRVLLSLFLLSSSALADVRISWDANPQTDTVTLYRVWLVGQQGKQLVGSTVAPTYTLPDNMSARTVVVTAVNAVGESADSSPLVIPATPQPPTAPKNLRIVP